MAEAARDEDGFATRVARRGKEKLTSIARQVGADLAENERDLIGAAENIVPPLKLVNAYIRALRAPPRAQTEATESPWYGASGDPGVRVAAAAIGAAAPGGKKPPRGLVNLKLREMSPEQAKAAALREEHLIEKPEGGYIGGPRNIKSRAQLAANRRRMDRELAEASAAIKAGGETVGDWYPSQRRGIAAIAEPWEQRRAAQETALMSSQTDPLGERGFMLTAHNRLARGEPPGIAHTGRQARELHQSAGQRDIRLGEKTGNYALLSDPTLPPTLFGTNDFRQARFHGYTEPSGAPQSTGLKPTQHAFLDAEGLLLTERANAKALGARTDWTGQMTQEVPWIAQKAGAIQSRSPARYPDTREGRRAAILEASKTGEDANPLYAVGANYERLPGPSTGHDPGILAKSLRAREQYGRKAPWHDPEGRDKIYRAMGYYQLPTTPGYGYWAGNVNPNFTAKPLADLVSGPAGREMDPGMMQTLRLGENFRGAMDVQEASTAHLPFSQSTRKAGTKDQLLLEHEGSLTPTEMRALSEAAPGYMPTPSPRGTMMMQFDRPAAKVREELPELQASIGQGQLPLERVAMESTGLIPVYARSTGQPIAPDKGIVTARLLRQAARSPRESVTRLGEDESVRKNIDDLIKRDLDRAALGAQIRDDVQRTREFFRDADWPKVVEMLRANPRLKVGAALAALGYSLPGMAEDEVPGR